MLFSLLSKLADIPLAVVDVETTGASAALGHKVIEVGIVRLERGRVTAKYEQLIDPQRALSPGITALTGITPAMLVGQPTFREAVGVMLPVLCGAAIVGHNIAFDLSFLHREFRRAGIDLCDCLKGPPVLDTVRIARRMFGRGGNGLRMLSTRLGCPPATSHRALADVETTAQVLEIMLARHGGWEMSLCDALSVQGGAIDMRRCVGADLLPLELEEALDLRKPVMMEYVDARGAITRRIIDPMQVRRSAGELLLVAFCHLRCDRRHFKVDRIARLLRIDPATGELLDKASLVVAVDEPALFNTVDRGAAPMSEVGQAAETVRADEWEAGADDSVKAEAGMEASEAAATDEVAEGPADSGADGIGENDEMNPPPAQTDIAAEAPASAGGEA